MLNLVSLTHPSLQIFGDFRISGQSLIKENYLNFRISNEIDKKLGPVTWQLYK